MLIIRLQRVGKKHQAHFRLVVGERRSKLKGEQTEILGWLNPRENKYELKKERILHWLKVGAKTSATVYNLLISAGVVSGKKISVHKIPKKTEAVATAQSNAT